MDITEELNLRLALLQAQQDARWEEHTALIGQFVQAMVEPVRDQARLDQLANRIVEVTIDWNKGENLKAELTNLRDDYEKSKPVGDERTAATLIRIKDEMKSLVLAAEEGIATAHQNAYRAHTQDISAGTQEMVSIPTYQAEAIAISDAVRDAHASEGIGQTVILTIEAIAIVQNALAKSKEPVMDAAARTQEYIVQLGEKVSDFAERQADLFKSYLRDDNSESSKRQDVNQEQVKERIDLDENLKKLQELFDKRHRETNGLQKAALQEQLDKQMELLREELAQRQEAERQQMMEQQREHREKGGR